jgi:hypothetical protein
VEKERITFLSPYHLLNLRCALYLSWGSLLETFPLYIVHSPWFWQRLELTKLFTFVIIQCLSSWVLESNFFARHYPRIPQSEEISYRWSYVWQYHSPPPPTSALKPQVSVETCNILFSGRPLGDPLKRDAILEFLPRSLWTFDSPYRHLVLSAI